MHARLNQPPFEANGSRLSSSLPSQSRVDQFSTTSPTHGQYFDSPVDESTFAHRTTALRQVHGVQGPSRQQQQQQRQQQEQQEQQQQQQQHRRTTSAGGRSSLLSQPVVVRTYSAEADEGSSRPSGMARGSRSQSNRPRPTIQPIRPPAVEDFSIEGVLRAIEPDIQSTLDSIAEICGRSRLSLANEYGSHRPPLGEIRAPSRPAEHGLLTVEEASSSAERLAGENVLVVGDDISTLDGRDPASSTYNLLESFRSNAVVGGHRTPVSPPWYERSLPHRRPDPQRTASEAMNPVPMPSTMPSQQPSQASNTLATSIPLLWGRLGREPGIDSQVDRQCIQTQPVISEIHLDVEAERYRHHQRELDAAWASTHPLNDNNHAVNKSLVRNAAERLSLLSDLQGWLQWWKGVGHQPEQTEADASPSAEMKLRAVLELHNMRLAAPTPVSQDNAF